MIVLLCAQATTYAQDEEPTPVGTTWQWVGYQSMDDSTIAPENPAMYLLTLNEDGTLNVTADCNVGGGVYALEGSGVTIEVQTLTRALCLPESLSEDYLRLLGDVVSYVIEDGDLYLALMMDAGIMQFTPLAFPTDVTWQWESYESEAISLTVKTPENLLLTLDSTDGTAYMTLDCNRGNAEYVLDGDSLTFGEMEVTEVGCPSDAGYDFQLYLGRVRAFAVVDDRLELYTRGGTMTFSRADE
ncbi:MAG: META domain-containing protein [Chloroflexota bacterium]